MFGTGFENLTAIDILANVFFLEFSWARLRRRYVTTPLDVLLILKTGRQLPRLDPATAVHEQANIHLLLIGPGPLKSYMGPFVGLYRAIYYFLPELPGIRGEIEARTRGKEACKVSAKLR